MRTFKYLATGLSLLCLLECINLHGWKRANANAADSSNRWFVATNGNDAWSGKLPSPNRNGTDGPFGSLKAAVEHSGQGARIFVRRGNFFLNEPVILRSENSGLTIESYQEEKPVLSGGRRITGWKEVTMEGKRCWAAEIPQVREGQWIFHQLWVNGRRAVRARHPNHGYLTVAEVPDATPEWTQGQTKFRFKEGDLNNWPSITNAEVVVMSRWVESRLPLKQVDEKERLVSFAKRSVFQLAKGDSYYLENAWEALDQPGEWYLDRTKGTLYYLPRNGEKMEQVEAIAPRLTEIIRFEGESAGWLQNVMLKGLTFAHNEWYFSEGFATRKDKPSVSPESQAEIGGFSQAAIGVPAAVSGTGMRNCQFEQCSFSHLGSYGLELGRGCQSNRVAGCEFFDLGAGGIKIGETGIREKAEEQAKGNEISDCRIHDGGRVFHSAIGVWIGQSPSNKISHNLIHDFYYTGISIGWTWGYGAALASNNLVEFNHVHHIGVQSDGDGPILSDMGGIYTLGKQPGTRIVNNLWHDIAGYNYGGWGIYLDEGSSGIVVQSNLVYRTTHGGFHQHYGETNLIVNNVFAFARDHQLQRSRVEPHPSFTFETNIVYFDKGVLLGGEWSGDQYVMDHNMYWDTRAGTNSLQIAGASLEKWRSRGHDTHSIVADPLFVAPTREDYRLKPGSPAVGIGFRPLDLTGVGPRK